MKRIFHLWMIYAAVCCLYSSTAMAQDIAMLTSLKSDEPKPPVFSYRFIETSSLPSSEATNTKPQCAPIEFLTVTNVTGTSMKLKWKHYGQKTKVRYFVFCEEVGTGQTYESDPLQSLYTPTGTGYFEYEYQINDLNISTLYHFKIWAECDFSVSPNYPNNWVKSEEYDSQINNTNQMTTSVCDLDRSSININVINYVDIKVKSTAAIPSNYGLKQYEVKLLQNNNLLKTESFDLYDNTPINFNNSNTVVSACRDYLIKVRPTCGNGTTTTTGNWVDFNITTPCCGQIDWVNTPTSTENSITANWKRNPYKPEGKFKVELFQNGVAVPNQSQIIEVVAAQLSYTHVFTGLVAGLTYDVKITPRCFAAGIMSNNNDPSNGNTNLPGDAITATIQTMNPCSAPTNISIGTPNSNNFMVYLPLFESTKERKFIVKLKQRNASGVYTFVKENVLYVNPGFKIAYTTFDNLTGGTHYQVEVEGACCSAINNYTCIWTPIVIPDNVKVVETPIVACVAPLQATVQNVVAEAFTVSWLNSQSGEKRFRVQLLDGLNIVKDTLVLSNNTPNQTINYRMYGLLPNTNYIIKVTAECCQNSSIPCYVWRGNEEVILTQKTAVQIPAACSTFTNTFSLIPNSDQVTITWTSTNPAPLSNTGRRFVVEYGTNPVNVVIIDDNTGSKIISGLSAATDYTFNIQEVFDGQFKTFTSACLPTTKSTLTLPPPTQCDPTFSATVDCASEEAMWIKFVESASGKANAKRVKYRNLTPMIKVAIPDLSVDCNSSMTYTLPTDVTLADTKPDFEWKENIIGPNQYMLSGLTACSFYEIEIETWRRKSDGDFEFCSKKTFPHYFVTKAEGYDAAQPDLDQDGLPDTCDDEVKPIEPPQDVSMEDRDCNTPVTITPENPTDLAYITGDIGQTWYIGGFPILVKNLSKKNQPVAGTYSGDGVLAIPFGKKKLLVKFDNATLKKGTVTSSKPYMTGNSLVTGKNDPTGTSITDVINKLNQTYQPKSFCGKTDQGDYNNGTHSGTGQPWGPNGFGSSGDYTKQPPYAGYTPGDPIDPKYDPNGFDKDGKTKTGDEYNECGCNAKGLTKANTLCDKTKCPPYWWVQDNPAPTEAGKAFYENIKGQLSTDILAILKQKETKYKSDADAQVLVCDNLRTTMTAINDVSLKYDELIVFGPDKEWIKTGMNKLFATPPLPFNVTMPRAKPQVDLEQNHIDLYWCDLKEVEYNFYLIATRALMNPTMLSALETSIARKIKLLSKAEVTDFEQNPAKFQAWLDELVKERIKYDVDNLMRSTGAVETKSSDDDTELAEAIVPSTMLGDLAADDNIINDLRTQATRYKEKIAEAYEQELQFQYEQGYTEIGGISRAFVLEEIVKQRAMEEFMSGNQPVIGQPIMIGKQVASGQKKQGMFLDNFKFTPTTASMDVYVIIESNEKPIVFTAKPVSFNASGLAGPVNIGLASDVSFPVSEIARFTLKGTGAAPLTGPVPADGTFVTIDCEGFKELRLDLSVEFCKDHFTPIDPITKQPLAADKYVKADIKIGVQSLQDFTIDNISISPFQLTKYPDYKWLITGMALDMSTLSTPTIVTFPTGYKMPSGVTREEWKGFYLKNISVVLPPKLFNRKDGTPVPDVSIDGLIIDETGLSGKLIVDDIIPIDNGSMGGWKYSVDKLSINVIQSKLNEAGFNGKVHIPLFKDEPKEYWEYSATFGAGKKYEFKVSPPASSEIDMWLATAKIDGSSVVKINYENDNFVATAILNGSISVGNDTDDNDKSKISMSDIPFQNLTLSSQAPYLIDAGTWGFPTVESHLGGFTFKLSGVNLSTADVQGIRESKLHFNLALELATDKGLDIAANGDFDLLGKVVVNPISKRQEYTFSKLQINELGLSASATGFQLAGKIKWFRNDAKFGNGFYGAVKISIEGMSSGGELGIEAVGIFGRKPKISNPDEEYKYFLVDVMARFGSGIPISAINLTGAGGGVYWHMNRANPAGAVSFSSPNLANLQPGQTISGYVYEPTETTGLGLKLMVSLELKGSPSAFNADAIFEVTFNDKGGLSYVRFDGVGRFMQNPNPSPNTTMGTVNGVVANLGMEYDVTNRIFAANLKVFANVGSGSTSFVRGCAGDCNNSDYLVGDAEMYFSPKTWYINIGRTVANRDRFISLGFGIDKVGFLKTDAYINIGNGVPPMPPLPNYVQTFLGDSFTPTDEGIRSNGKGFAFGARVEVAAGGEFGVVYADVKAGLGFDIMMVNYGDTKCKCLVNNVMQQVPIGINGWYASGQAYVYLSGEIGAKVLGQRIPIIKAGVAAAMQAKGPNPFWAKGAIGIEAKVMGIGIKEVFDVEIGKKCDPVASAGTGTGTSNDQNKVIATISPDDKEEDVSLLSEPKITFNVPLEKEFDFATITDSYKATARIKEIKLVRKSDNLEIPITQEWVNNGKMAMTIKRTNLLPANTELKLTVKTEVVKGNGAIMDTEEKTLVFKTEKAFTIIPRNNVAAQYPMDGMYNYYRLQDNTNQGHIQLKQGQPELLSNIPQGYEKVIRFYLKGNEIKRLPLTYEVAQKRINFTIPNQDLIPGSIYKMEVGLVPTGYPMTKASSNLGTSNNPASPDSDNNQVPTSKPSPKVLLTSYFRVSQHANFYEKMKNVTTTVTETTAGSMIYDIKFNGLTEPLDAFELGQENNGVPLVIGLTDVEQSNWYKDLIYPNMYAEGAFPRDIEAMLPQNEIFEYVSLPSQSQNDTGVKLVDFASQISTIRQYQGKAVSRITSKEYATNNVSPWAGFQQGIRIEMLRAIKNDFNSVESAITDLCSQACNLCKNAQNCCGNNTKEARRQAYSFLPTLFKDPFPKLNDMTLTLHYKQPIQSDRVFNPLLITDWNKIQQARTMSQMPFTITLP